MILRTLVFAWLICSATTSCHAAAHVLHIPPAAVDERKLEEDILRLINNHRKSIGLVPLANNSALAEQARLHSEDMANHRMPFGHKGFQDRMKKIAAAVSGIRSGAENVAMGQMSAQEVVEGWLKSAGHRQNIEGPYSLSGIGIATDPNGQLYFTQIFAGK